MNTLAQLHADAHQAVAVALTTAPPAIAADAVRRVLAGTGVTYGQIGHTSAGPLRIRAGAIRLPADLTRVKLLERHTDPTGRVVAESVGYLLAVQHRPDGMGMSFKIGSGPAGDKALLDADEKTRDGFSVELAELRIEGDEVVDALLTAVAHVAVPAYADSRIDRIAASAHPSTGANMTPEQIARLNELRARQANLTEAERTELHELEQQAAATAEPPAAPPAQPTPQQPAPAPPAPQQPAPPAPAQPQPPAQPAPAPAPLVDPADPARGPQATPGSAQAAMAPWGAQGAVTTQPRAQQPSERLQSLFASMGQLNTGQMSPELTAALADITYSEHPFTRTPAYSGELWSGVEYQRIFTPLLAQGTLTAHKGKGWRWVTKPDVGDYAGDKAAIPTNEPVTEESDWTAARIAGGHDIDRAYRDFGDAEFFAAYYRAMAEAVAYRLDMKAAQVIADLAVPVTQNGQPGGTPIDPVAGLLKAVALGAAHVKRNTRANATFVLVNDLDMLTLLDYTNQSVPAFLELLGITPGSFRASSTVTAGTVQVGVRQAATWRELPGNPIRVETVDLARGGIDTGVFAYWAAEVHHERGIVEVPFE